jgi:hypothetical protein
MPRFDPEVIAALAEGRLSAEEAARLEAEIGADPMAAAELEAQRAALTFIRDTPPASLDTAERTELRAAVADALGVVREPGAATATRRVPWGAIGVAAAALAGLVAIVPVAGLLSTGGDDTSFDLAAEAPTTEVERSETAADDSAEPAAVAAAPTEEALLAEGDGGAGATGLGASTEERTVVEDEGAEFSADSAAAAEAPTTSAAPGTTATTAAPSTTSSTTSTTTTTADPGLQQLEDDLRSLRGNPAALAALAVDADSTSPCWQADTGIRPDPPPERLTFSYSSGGYDVVVFYVDDGTGPGPFQVWTAAECAALLVVDD